MKQIEIASLSPPSYITLELIRVLECSFNFRLLGSFFNLFKRKVGELWSGLVLVLNFMGFLNVVLQSLPRSLCLYLQKLISLQSLKLMGSASQGLFACFLNNLAQMSEGEPLLALRIEAVLFFNFLGDYSPISCMNFLYLLILRSGSNFSGGRIRLCLRNLVHLSRSGNSLIALWDCKLLS